MTITFGDGTTMEVANAYYSMGCLIIDIADGDFKKYYETFTDSAKMKSVTFDSGTVTDLLLKNILSSWDESAKEMHTFVELKQNGLEKMSDDITSLQSGLTSLDESTSASLEEVMTTLDNLMTDVIPAMLE